MKRRPGYTEEQIDKEAVLLRAYGSGTEVIIDRDSKAMQNIFISQAPGKMLRNAEQEKHSPTSCSPSITLLLLSLLGFRMVCYIATFEAEYALQKT